MQPWWENNHIPSFLPPLKAPLPLHRGPQLPVPAEPSPFILTVGMLLQQQCGSHGKAAPLASGSENLVSLRGQSSLCACLASLMWRKFPLILWGNILLCVFQQNIKNPTLLFFGFWLFLVLVSFFFLFFQKSLSQFDSLAGAPARPAWDSTDTQSLSLLPLCWLLFSCLINYLPS